MRFGISSMTLLPVYTISSLRGFIAAPEKSYKNVRNETVNKDIVDRNRVSIIKLTKGGNIFRELKNYF